MAEPVSQEQLRILEETNDKKYLGRGIGALFGAFIGALLMAMVWTVNTAWGRYDLMAAQSMELKSENNIQNFRIEQHDKQLEVLEDKINNMNTKVDKIYSVIVGESKNGK